MHPIFRSLIPILALCACEKAKETPVPKAKAGPEAATASPAMEAEYPAGIRTAITAPRPFQEFRKYTGMADGKLLIVEMNLKDCGSGMNGLGTYRYAGEGNARSAHANFFDTARFEFVLWDSTGNFYPVTLTGRYDGLDSFEGAWTRYRPDSVRDQHGNWRQMRVRLGQGPFKLVRTLDGQLPLRFEVYAHENDSTRDANIRENKIEFRSDTLPSNQQLSVVRALTGVDSLDTVLNLGFDRAMKEFCEPGSEHPIPPGVPFPAFADSLFARSWKSMEGRFSSDTYSTDVEANEHGVLSLKFGLNGYSGGAHGTYNHVYASFDTRTGRKIGLKDILADGFKETLGAMAGIHTCFDDPDEEYACEIDGLVQRGFAIRHDGLVFHANIAMRDRDVFLPWADLAPILKPDGTIAPFLADLKPAR